MPANAPIVQLLPRARIDERAWDACVAESEQSLVYGFTWYLDTVLPAPNWRWEGLVLPAETGGYRAVLPVPLRRKAVAGLTCAWVVHQPFFCQLLRVFGPSTIDPTPFFQLLRQRFRYASVLYLVNSPPTVGLAFVRQPAATHVLDLSVGYAQIQARYVRDRRLNLRRAVAARWSVVASTDPEPLLTLFRDQHAAGIPGGVAAWAYELLRNLHGELQKRGLVILRYALRNDSIEAGALFVCTENRIIYLFNAASEAGRRGNARTLLIDQIIQENAGQNRLFDFESPSKPSIVAFYQSFGAVEAPYWSVRWNRLSPPERFVSAILRRFQTRAEEDVVDNE